MKLVNLANLAQVSGRESDQVQALAQRDVDTDRQWAEAMRAHAMAPPDIDFAERLAETARAAAARAELLESAEHQGMQWPGGPGAGALPYELRYGTGRRGPAKLWRAFDAAVEDLERALGDTDLHAVALGFAQLAQAADTLARAVAQEDQSRGATDRSQVKSR